jgi:ammonia channel protein AmtB
MKRAERFLGLATVVGASILTLPTKVRAQDGLDTGDTAWILVSTALVLFFMFQLTFAIITPALIVGAFAERMRFSAMMLFSAVWMVLVYLPICHMT